MYKIILLIILLQIISCTDQGDPILYSITNSSLNDFKVILFSGSNKYDTLSIKKFESKVLSQDLPPYDCGPLCGYDSLKVIFDNSKILKYVPLKSNSECVDSVKNPFCPYSNYMCENHNCTFEIDYFEYLKAK
jgi:hypothetical protein